MKEEEEEEEEESWPEAPLVVPSLDISSAGCPGQAGPVDEQIGTLSLLSSIGMIELSISKASILTQPEKRMVLEGR